MLALGAERRSPFRPIRNPFERVLPAVDENARGVLQSIRDTGRAIADRITRSQAQDVSRLAQARATIAHAVDFTRTHVTRDNARTAVQISTQAAKEATHYVATHKMEIAKKVAPSLAISITAKLAGAALAAPVIVAGAVAGGANEARRNIGTLNATKADGIFATSAVLRNGFERNTARAQAGTQDNANFSSTEGTSVLQRIAQSKVGRGMRAYMHAEKRAASHVVSHNAHIDRVMAFAPDATARANASIDIDYLNRLRMDAAMARMTATTDVERAAARTVHQAVRERMRALETEAGPHSAIPYINSVAERQILRAQRSVQFGKSYRNIVIESIAASSGVRALKSALTSAGIFLGLSAVGVDAASPLRSLKDTMWGNVSDGIGRLAHSAGNGAQDLITHVLTATTPAAEAADLPVHDVQEVVRDSAPSGAPLPPVSPTQAALGPEAWTAQARSAGHVAFNNSDPRLTTTVHVVNGETFIEQKGVLAFEAPKPVMPKAVDPSYVAAPREPSFVRVPVADRVAIAAEVNAPIPMHEVARTVQEVQEYTIEGKVSWTQDIFDRKLLSGMQDAAHSMDWYGVPGTAERMVKEVFAVNPDLMDADDMQEMQEYLATHPDASFVQMWKDLQHTVFSDDMDKLTDGTAYKVLSEHTVVLQDPIAEINEEDAIAMGARRASKPPGLAKLAQSTDQQTAPPTPPTSVRMSNEEYLAMRQAVASGQPVNPVGATAGATTDTGRPTAEEYLAMTRNHASTPNPMPITTSNSTHGNTSVEEYQRLVAQAQQGNANVGEAVNHSATVHNPRMDTNEYLRIQRETAAKAAEAARASNQMDPQEYMRQVAEINARNGGGGYISTTPVTSWEGSQVTGTEASVIGPVDLRNGLNHTMSISSDSPSMFHTTDTAGNHLPINTNNIPMTQVVNPNIYIDTPAYNSVTYFYDPVEGGLVINGHTGRWTGEIQLLEGFREYVEGYGFNGHQMYGPAQLQRLAQEYVTLNSGSTTEFTFDGRSITTRLTSFSVDYRDTTRPFGEPYRLIGSGPDTITLVGCNWSHIEAIGMISSLEEQAGLSIPAEYSGALQTIRDPYASAEQVTAAVQRVLPWLRQLKNENKFDYDTFHTLIGNLPGESKTFDEMPGLADHGKIRMVFELVR